MARLLLKHLTLLSLARKPVDPKTGGDGIKVAKLEPYGTLFLRVWAMKGGLSRSWIVVAKIRGKRLHQSIGTFEEINREADAAAIAERRIKRYLETGLALSEPDQACTSVKPKTIEELFPQWVEYFTHQNKERPQYVNDYVSFFRNHILGSLKGMLPDMVTTADLNMALVGIDRESDTLRKVKRSISLFFEWLTASNLIEKNPTDSKSFKLPKASSKPKKHKNHPAIPYKEVPRFIAALTARNSLIHIGSQALLFTILNAGRASMTCGVPDNPANRGLLWREISEKDDQGRTLLHLDASRMKVPDNGDFYAILSRQCLALLKYVKLVNTSNPINGADSLVFPSTRGNSLSDNTMRKRIHDLDAAEIAAARPGFRDTEKKQVRTDKYGKQYQPIATPHGISRGCFGTWCDYAPGISNMVKELCLHHVNVNDKYNGAYSKEKEKLLLKERGEALQRWADFCFSECPPDNPILQLMKNSPKK